MTPELKTPTPSRSRWAERPEADAPAPRSQRAPRTPQPQGDSRRPRRPRSATRRSSTVRGRGETRRGARPAAPSVPQGRGVPRQLGKYRLGKQLGSGGMGDVYEATSINDGHRVAIKVLHAQLSQDSQFTRRFLIEARACMTLKHPNVIRVLGVGRHDPSNTLFMAMELLEGKPLDSYLNKRLNFGSIIKVCKGVARALEHAAQHAIVHRDVKPANIMLGADKRVTLLDFGLAKCLNINAQLTVMGTTVGTPEYMSPEQAVGGTVDVRSDLYSLGVILYRMLTGSLPFAGETVEMMRLHHDREPLDVCKEMPRMPRGFGKLLRRMLAKSPSQRYCDPTALLQDLSRLEHTLRSSKRLNELPDGPQLQPLRIDDPMPVADRRKRAVTSADLREPASGRRWLLGVGLGFVGLSGLLVWLTLLR